MIKTIFKKAPWKRTLFFMIADALIFYFSYYASYMLRFNLKLPPEHIVGASKLVFIIIFFKIALFYIFRVYSITWRYFVLSDAKKIIFALLISYIFFILYVKLIYVGAFPRTVILIDFLVSLFLVVGLRLSKRMLGLSKGEESPHNALIIGANQKALDIIGSAQKGEIEFNIELVLDSDRSLINSYISGIKVDSIDRLEELVEKNSIDSAILTKEYPNEELDELFERLNRVGIRQIKRAKLLGDRYERLQDISIEDLLARKPKDLDSEVISSFVKDKTIMITGAGGSIGSEIARQCEKFGAKELILLDHSEYNLYAINEQIKKVPTIRVMQSVVDRKLLEECFKKHRPQIVIHAAAYKHVPLCEENVEGAVLNNIIGTKNTIDLSIEYGVEKFVLISTDKAVRPTNVMGATKRVCELYAQNVSSQNTQITAVRFGNVLGSSGSVIPKFKYLIEHDRPLTITHPEITRYFMLIPEACQLVLQAAAIAKNRELFVLDMGEPIKIVDFAKKMLKLYNKEHLGIEFTGLRAGEKLYEELLLNENDKKTIYNSIFVTKATSYDIIKLNSDIERLLANREKVAILKEIVLEFNHNI